MVTPIQFGTSDSNRRVSRESRVFLRNRFLERNPSLNDSPASAISRPTLKKLTEVGTGPVRKVYTSPGVFDDCLFAVSGSDLYRIETDSTSSLVGTISTSSVGDVSMAATAPIGDTVPAYLFIAEGGVLWVYTDNGQALGHLQASGSLTSGDVVRIDTVYYQFTSGSVDTGSPAGTVGNPWLVAMGGSTAVAFTNLFRAIGDSGTGGTDYSTALTAHTTVLPYTVSGADLYVNAVEAGTGGNAIVTTETGATLSWSGGTLAGGGDDMIRQVPMPDDVGAISVGHINSYVVVIPVQAANINGRFYYINPGETVVDPLSYATAERSPDPIHQVVVFGDMFWLMGEKTTEPWITTGDITAPVARFQGILFDRGSWEGTAVQIKDSLVVVDEDGGVFQIANGQKRISTPQIEERIRRAILLESL